MCFFFVKYLTNGDEYAILYTDTQCAETGTSFRRPDSGIRQMCPPGNDRACVVSRVGIITGGGIYMSKKFNVQTLVGMGILTAIVIVLQGLASAIRFGPFSITLVLAPIIIGAALYGWKAGAWLGFVFGVMVLLTDAGAFLAINVPGTIITCLLKGMLAGAAAGAVYKLLEKKNQWAAVLTSAVVCPVVNTGVFLIGCVLFFLSTVREWGTANGYENVGAYFLFGFVGVNFLVEMVINLVLSTAIIRILNIIKKPAASAE